MTAKRLLARNFSVAPKRLPACVAQLAQGADVLQVNPVGIAHRIDGPFDAGLAQQVQRGVRRPVGVVIDVIRLRIRKLVLRMETRDLQLTLELQIGDRGIAHFQKLIVLGEVIQHPGMNQQDGLALRRIRGVQPLEFVAQVFEQSRCGTLLTDLETHAAAAIWAFGERTQVQAYDRPLQPAARVRNDFVMFDGCCSDRVSYALD